METTLKQIRRLFLLLCLITVGAQSAWAQDLEAYAVINIETDVMTFYCDIFRSTHESNQNEAVYSLNTGGNRPEWTNADDNYHFHVREVVFDNTFRNARPTSTSGWFAGMTLLSKITFYGSYGSSHDYFETLNTSEVTNMNGMFSNCESLTSLDLRFFDTSKVTSMRGMFANCSELTTLYLSNWHTENVTNMSSMFEGCRYLTSLDLNNWNTSSVTDMSYMFRYCSGLTGLDLNNWNTASVTNMTDMFNGCSGLNGINARDWNTSNVLSMPNMFKDCRNLSALNLKNWNTSGVVDMSGMFSGCWNLSFINDISKWNTSHVHDMSSMFESCSSFVSLDLSNWNTSGVTDMSNMFKGCSHLETIYVGSNWSTKNVTSSEGMFTNCTKLVGGRGTVCEGNPYLSLNYAHVDSPSSPGYLSDHSQEQMNLVLTAGVCDKGIEVWNGDTQVGSVSQEGGTFWGEIENALSLQLRVPNQYLEKIILNDEDVTASLSSTTPTDPAYEGYTFYSLTNVTGLMVIEVQYNYVAPHPYETYGLSFTIDGGPGTANAVITYADGTSESLDMEHDGEGSTILNHNYNELHSGHPYATTKEIERIVVTAHPENDEPSIMYFYPGYANQTQVTNNESMYSFVYDGNGTYTYTLPGENMTSSNIYMYFPPTQENNIKTTIAVNGDYQVKYFFFDFDPGLWYHNVKTSDDYIQGQTTVTHNGSSDSYGNVFIYLPESNRNFRVIFNGEVVPFNGNGNVCLKWTGGWTTSYDSYMQEKLGYNNYTKVPCWQLSISDDAIKEDSWILIDDGTTPLDQIVSPWQITQNVNVIGDGILSLRNSEGTVVATVSEGEATTANWPKGDNLTLAVTLPDGADIANYEAILIIDGTESELQKVNGAFTTFDMGSIATAHNIVLITRQTGGFVNTDLLTQHIQLTGEQLGTFLIQYLDEDGADYDDAQADNGQPYYTFTSDEKKYIKGLGIYVNVPQGCTFKASFNGEEVTGFTLDASNYTVTLDESFVTDGTWVVEFKKAEGITWSAVAAGDVAEGLADGGIGVHLTGEGDVDLIDINLSPTLTNDTWCNVAVPSPNALSVSIYCKPGYEVTSVTFHGNEYINSFEKSSDGTYYEFNCDDDVSPFLVDGTWVVEFKKAEGVTWSGMITGDTEEDLCLLQVMLNNNAIDYNISAMEGCPYDTFKKQFVGNASELFIDFIAKDGYDFKLSFNGTEFPYEFTKELYFEEESLYDYRFRTTDADLIAPFLVDGTWVLTYKKVAEAGITWDGMIIGDVPQGAVVDIGLDGMTMEVFLNAEETSASDTYTGPTDGIGMDAVLTVPAGYSFKVWFNGEEKTDKFDESGIYHINMDNPTELAPYLQDGQWIVLFYDDLERYDLNGDKKVDIADVTTMVNKVLRNDQPSSNP